MRISDWSSDVCSSDLVGLFLVRRYPAVGGEGWSQAVASWLGLPSLISAGVLRPFERATEAMAWIDDRILDAGPRGVAGLARTVSLSVARHDQHVVDRGVEWAAALGEWLARLSARIGERLADGMPEGAATIVGMSAQDARRLQTGM